MKFPTLSNHFKAGTFEGRDAEVCSCRPERHTQDGRRVWENVGWVSGLLFPPKELSVKRGSHASYAQRRGRELGPS